MSMNDNARKLPAKTSKFPPDPTKIGQALLFEWDEGLQPCMNEDVIGKGYHVFKRADEIKVLLGDAIVHPPDQSCTIHFITKRRIETIAHQSCATADLIEELRSALVAVHGAQEQLLMVALEEHQLLAGL